MAEDDRLKREAKTPGPAKHRERVAPAKSRLKKGTHGKVSGGKNPQRDPKKWIGGGG